jgi:hypothetical protein
MRIEGAAGTGSHMTVSPSATNMMVAGLCSQDYSKEGKKKSRTRNRYCREPSKVRREQLIVSVPSSLFSEFMQNILRNRSEASQIHNEDIPELHRCATEFGGDGAVVNQVVESKQAVPMKRFSEDSHRVLAKFSEFSADE